MAIEKTLDNILSSSSKVRISRLFICRREDFLASGREIARLTGVTPPAAHAALKDLYNQGVLKRDIIGREHIYRLNANSRVVRDMLKPVFEKEHSVKEDISRFIKEKIKEKKIQNNIVSVILYGSLQKDSAGKESDVDIAVIVKDKTDKKEVEIIFLEDISGQFSEYFGLNLDSYIKTKNEFIKRLSKKNPPVSTMIKSYSVIYGEDPLSFRQYER